MDKKRAFVYAVILGIIPWIAYVVISPVFNRAEPLILGMPPLMFWDVIWLFLTSLCLYGAYRMELRGGLLE
ncbi:MAG: hypothetical protein DRN30_01995 [Thermoplasmata archaeon]|nr:MAG: hypothetical protein DRN30_01995 [Thermoplasmata archaeon]